MEPYLASHLDTVRALPLRVLDATPEELADRVPEGYVNSIRWNLGHIKSMHALGHACFSSFLYRDTI